VAIDDTLSKDKQFLIMFKEWRSEEAARKMVETHRDMVVENIDFWIMKSMDWHSLEMVRYLLNFNTDDLSEIMVGAARKGQKDFVQLLLPHSNPAFNNSKALQWASVNQDTDVFDLLYPLSNAKDALRALKDISTNPQDWVLLHNRVEAERLQKVLRHEINGQASEAGQQPPRKKI